MNKRITTSVLTYMELNKHPPFPEAYAQYGGQYTVYKYGYQLYSVPYGVVSVS